MRHVLTAEAYERKAELGGGFRGVVLIRAKKARLESPVLTSLEDARRWAKAKVFEIMGDTAWAPGYVLKPNWRMNVWAE